MVKPSTAKGEVTGQRKIFWKIPIDQIDLDKFMPVFAIGLREKQEPQMFLAFKGLESLIKKLDVKTLLK